MQGRPARLSSPTMDLPSGHDGGVIYKDTSRRLRYASGYIELGMINDASDELEAIRAEDRFAVPVLVVRLELHMAANHWETVVGLGRELAQQSPKHERAWICWAYALRELQRVDEARAVLLEAEPLHGRTSALLHYNLACYYCLLGEQATARQRLAQACKLAPGFKEDARHDPDLANLAK